MDVLRHELEVELSKLDTAPFDPRAESDFDTLLEELPRYHDGPRNSPTHLYAALADDSLVWRRAEIPASQLLMGPGPAGLHTEVATQAEGFVDRFARLVRERYREEECFKSYFWDAEIRYPIVPCVLVNYGAATPWLPEPKKDYGPVYRLQDGYHRTFQMILRGKATIPSFAACCRDGSPWEGNYGHLARFENGRWIPRDESKMSIENADIPDTWSSNPGYISRFQTDEQIDEILELLDLGSARGLVDVGCSNGAFALAAAERYPHCQVWAIDPLASAIAECQKQAAARKIGNLQTEVASADALPLGGSSVDRALMRNVLHHLAHPDRAYAELARALSPDGLLLLEAPCNPGDTRLGKLISDVHMFMDDSHRRTYHRPDAIVSGLDAHGISASVADTWTYSPRVREEQIRLIEQHGAQEALRLRQENSERWTIQLNMARIVGRRGES